MNLKRYGTADTDWYAVRVVQQQQAYITPQAFVSKQPLQSFTNTL